MPEVVHLFEDAMPTGVTVSRDGRVFVNFPRWGDQVDFTVAELKNGEVRTFRVWAADAGLSEVPVDAIRGGDGPQPLHCCPGAGGPSVSSRS